MALTSAVTGVQEQISDTQLAPRDERRECVHMYLIMNVKSGDKKLYFRKDSQHIV